MGDSMSTIINATTTNGVVIQPDNSGSLVLQTNSGTTALTISTAQDTTLAGKLTTASSGIQFSDASTQTAAASPYVLKNRIINGDMRIDQRNAGASVTITTDSTYTLDRWMCEVSQASKFSVQQDAAAVTPPTGFNDYLGVTSLSSYSVGTSDYFTVMQRIEGYNVADLDFGKATAKTITISFWVRSSLTGTFGGSIGNSAENRSYPFSYTISAANTWEQKTVTIAGDTTGTWLVTNGRGLNVRFSLGMGSTFTDTANAWTTKANVYSATGATSVVGTNGATFYITGVQLEQNTSATPFERRLYNQELANCQRYFYVAVSGASKAVCMASYQTSAYMEGVVNFPVEMRTAPSLVVATGTNYYAMYRSNAFDYVNSFLQEFQTTLCSTLYNTTEASGTTGNAGWILSDNASGKISFSAEL
jgi:hypothetical protein